MTGILSLKPRCCESGIMHQVIKNHSVCDGCYVTPSLDVFGLLLEHKLRWIHMYLMRYIWQLVFAYISIKGWIIHSDEDGFIDGSCQIMIFSVHNAEFVDRYIMTSGVMMVMDMWWDFCVFFLFFIKCSAWLLNVFLFTFHSATLVSVYHPIFLLDGISILGFNKNVLDITASLEVHLYAMFAADVILQLSLKPLIYGTTMWCLFKAQQG